MLLGRVDARGGAHGARGEQRVDALHKQNRRPTALEILCKRAVFIVHILRSSVKIDRQSSPPARRLELLLKALSRQVMKNRPLVPETPTYTVPDWALYTGAACIFLSLGAAVAGHWISSKTRSRYTPSMLVLIIAVTCHCPQIAPAKAFTSANLICA